MLLSSKIGHTNKPVEIKPIEIKPVEIKPVEIKPVEIKNIEKFYKPEDQYQMSPSPNHQTVHPSSRDKNTIKNGLAKPRLYNNVRYSGCDQI